MFAIVSAEKFKQTILQCLPGGKAIINLRLHDNNLEVQSQGLIIDETSIPIEEGEVGERGDISVQFDKSIQLLKPQGKLRVQTTENALVLEQNNFRTTLLACPEQRVDTGALEVKNFQSILAKAQVYSLVDTSKALDGVAKVLAEAQGSAHIRDNMAYILYSNTAVQLPFTFPDCAISSDTLRKLVPILRRGTEAKYSLDKSAGIVRMKVDEDEVVAFSVQNANAKRIYEFTQAQQSLKAVGDYNFAKIANDLDIICKVYSRGIIDVAFCVDGNLRVSKLSGQPQFFTGSSEPARFTIALNVAQVATTQKLFGEDSEVKVSRGGTCICLTQLSSRKSLLLFGMIY